MGHCCQFWVVMMLLFWREKSLRNSQCLLLKKSIYLFPRLYSSERSQWKKKITKWCLIITMTNYKLNLEREFGIRSCALFVSLHFWDKRKTNSFFRYQISCLLLDYITLYFRIVLDSDKSYRNNLHSPCMPYIQFTVFKALHIMVHITQLINQYWYIMN